MTFFGVDVRNGVPVGLGSIAAFGRRGFTPASLFAQGQPGVWYDASDLGTMFTTSDGTTPVTAVEQAVGLILDKSRGLAVGAELVTNGDFSSATGWTAEAGWSIGSGVATAAVTGTNLTGTSFPVVAGRTYRVEFDVVTFTSGILYVRVGEGTATTFTTTGRKSAILTATNTTGVQFFGGSIACSIDNVSVREIAGTHAIQATAASRPVLRNRYNQLTFSEQFDNAAWSKTTATVVANAAVAPDGTTTADLIYPTTTGSTRGAYQSFTGLAASYTGIIYAKAAGKGFIAFYDFPGSLGAGWVNLSTGATSSVRAGHTFVVTNAGSGWWRIAMTATPTAGTRYWQFAVCDAADDFTATTSGTDGIFVWGADLRSANDTIYPYQRIEAATVYDSDTSKFPLYLACDGSDDSLYTAANLDLSSTDKVTVFAGVTKLSDAAFAIIAELSAQGDTNNGGFISYFQTPSKAGFSSKGTSPAVYAEANIPAAPLTLVHTGQAGISDDSAILRVNGVQIASSTSDQGSGNYGTYPLYIGRRNNASAPLNGRIHQIIVRGAASSAAEISSAERWVAGKQGRAL
jgi:hypothetical protein